MRFSLIAIKTRLEGETDLEDNLKENLKEVMSNPALLSKVLLIQEKYYKLENKQCIIQLLIINFKIIKSNKFINPNYMKMKS